MKKIIAAAIMLAVLSGCGGKKSEKQDREAAYVEALNDSINAVNREIESCDQRLKEVHDEIGAWLHDFTNVANPREAGAYTIFTSFKDKYPLTNTGLAARINSNGQLELIAALKGAKFNQIAVLVPDQTVESDTVLADQALNYTADGLTTVMFTGPKAVAIAKLIADNQLNRIRISFIKKGPVLMWNLPNETANMVMATYLLYDRQQEAARLELRIPMLHEKINLLRAHRDRRSPQQEGKAD